ncbi:uncharacterized protein MCAP_0864-like [Clytia hemisphaerica]|uniref:uncharacterized protein MCAP_0864-like n=1 Tax=Clytia hemisphaerica TaxID=252671 RepID=UPI0034D4A403
MSTKKRDPPSPLENISNSIEDLRNHTSKKARVHFGQSTLPKITKAKPSSKNSEPPTIENTDGSDVILESGFETSRPPANPFIISAPAKKKKLKIILHEHSFSKPYDLNTLNSHIKNFTFLSAKEAHTKESVLLCEIDIVDIDALLDKENWSNKISNLSLDRKSHLLDSYCVNKIASEDKKGPLVNLNTIYEKLIEKDVKRIFNLRREETSVNSCKSYMETVQGKLDQISTYLERIENNCKNTNTKLIQLEKNMKEVNSTISNFTSRIDKIETSLTDMKESYVTKTELSEELSQEIHSISKQTITHHTLSLVLFEAIYAIEEQKMTGHFDICFHLQAILKRHIPEFDKNLFMTSIDKISETSLIVSKENRDSSASV